jgi:hypothetical protein
MIGETTVEDALLSIVNDVAMLPSKKNTSPGSALNVPNACICGKPFTLPASGVPAVPAATI